jgi:hypothetical protein
MDGAVISDVHYRDITMSNVRSAIMQKVGTRRRCGNSPGIGRITNITYDNITSTGQTSNNFSATLWGESAASNRISNVSFNNVNITVPGGNGTMGTGVPSNDPNNYNPNSIGTRPAYGWYIHNANGIRFNGGSVHFNANDGRPGVIANTGSTVTFDNYTVERSTGSNDLIFQTVTGFCVQNSQNTTGGALRVSQTGSTQSCATQPPPNRHEAESAVCDGTIDSDHAGFSGTGFCNTANAVGASVEWTVNAASAGSATLTLGFANGTAADRPMNILVNGVVASAVSFTGNSEWTSWRSASVTVALAAGTNTVRAVATTANGGPNLDYLDTP